MHMQLVDWLIVLIPLAVVLLIGWRTMRYMRGVSDFLAAGRCAGRYLVCNAIGEAGMGAISVIAVFEMFYEAGFAVSWWGALVTPVGLLMTLSGFVIYRYRETRAMTLAQFFEMRYSKRFRVFMGLMAFGSGVVNYGIFPAVAARFFVYFCGFPPTVHVAGLALPTFAIVMAILLGFALVFTLLGGQLTAMVTDCVEGLISGVMYLVIAVALLVMFSWSDISEAMMAVPEGKSMFNPFQTGKVENFNIWFVLIGIFTSIYTCMAWQGNQGFNCAAASPHEAKMGRILGHWREFSRRVMIALLAAAAFTFLNHPHYASNAQLVNNALSSIDNPAIQQQMRVPVALAYLLPVGIKGVFAAIMLFAMIACDSSYLHSWGSIFIQDVVLPFRKRKLEPHQHIRLLRWSITGVAVFAFCFSLVFRQTDYILMFFAITGAIFLGGAGSAILGGLYWKKGTTAGAWAGMITGSVLAVGGIIWQQLDPAHAFNGQYLSFIAMLSAICVYVTVSLLTARGDFNMDRMLHRGEYAVDDLGRPLTAVAKPPRTWKSLLGIDASFTPGDRMQSIALFAWSMFWFAVFVVVTAWNLVRIWPTRWWANYYYVVGIWMPLVLGAITTIWFTIGGVRDLRRLFVHLRTTGVDTADDGSVARPAEPAVVPDAHATPLPAPVRKSLGGKADEPDGTPEEALV